MKMSVAGRVVRLFSALCLAFMGVPVVALAEDTASATVSVGNGWTLSVSVENNEAQINGIVEPAGSGKLTIPESFSIGGTSATVTAIGKLAFLNQAALTEIELPDTLTTLGESAFWGAGLTSITIPENVVAIPTHCFSSCESLESVTFECESMLYLGEYAFSYTGIKEIDIPTLTGTVTDSGKTGSGNYRIGEHCFYYCSQLEKVIFEGDEAHNASTHFGTSYAGLTTCSNLTTLVYRCYKTSSLGYLSTTPRLSSSGVYHTVDFYNSEQDAASATNRVARVTYPATADILKIVKGEEDPSLAYEGSDAIPTPPQGKAWGVSRHAITHEGTLLANSYSAIAVDPDNLNYAWISSPEIETYYGSPNASNGNDGNRGDSYYHLEADGVADVSNLVVVGADGAEIDPSKYTLTLAKGGYDDKRRPTNIFEDVSKITQIGYYRVTAKGKGEFADTTTTATINVSTYSPSVVLCNSATREKDLGTAAYTAASRLESTPSFTVVTDADNWQFGLVASGLAGAGGGTVALSSGEDTTANTYRAIIASGSDSAVILGSTDVVPESVEERIDGLSEFQAGGSIDRFSSQTCQQMAVEVFETVKKYGPVYGYSWGDTAILASPSSYYSTIAIAQLAHQLKAPVFFAEDDGSISDETKGALSDGGFAAVRIAGGAEVVSESAAQAVAEAAGVEPERLLVGGTNAGEISDELFKLMQSDYGYSDRRVVIASASDPSYVLAGSELAAVTSSRLIVCSSSIDMKALQDQITASGINTITDLWFVGDFSAIDPDAATRLQSIWTSPQSTAVGMGDTFENNGLLYKLASGSAVTFTRVLDKGISGAISVDSAVYNGQTKTVTSVQSGAFADRSFSTITLGSGIAAVSAGAFSGCSGLSSVRMESPAVKTVPSGVFSGIKTLKTVSFAAAPTAIANSAFRGCSNLAKLEFKTASLKTIGKASFAGCTKLSAFPSSCSALTSIGDGAFQGCTSLKSVAFSGNVLKAIGATAFQGCSSLNSATFSGGKLQMIGASAFNGCSSLKAFYAPSKALVTIGASSFKNCKALKSARFASAKLKKIGAAAFQGAKKLKTVEFKTMKLVAKNIGKAAFKGTAKKATFKVPKSRITKYKKLFCAKGASKKAKFKRV